MIYRLLSRFCPVFVVFLAFSPSYSQNNSLNFAIFSQPSAFTVCESSGFYALYLSNISGEVLRNPKIEMTLPPNVHVVSGSSGMVFPIGSNYSVVNDPVVQGQQVVWDLTQSSPLLLQNGFGLDSTQLGLVLRFRLELDCAFENGGPASMLMASATKLDGSVVQAIEMLELNVERIETGFAIEDFSVRYTGGSAAYYVLVRNTGENLFSGLKLKFYTDTDESGDLTPGDVLEYSDNIGFSIGPGAAVPLAKALPLDLAKMCRLIVVLSADETCLCADVSFRIIDLVRELMPTQGCVGDLINLGVPNVVGHSYTWSPPAYLSCYDCAHPVFQINDLQETLTIDFTFTERAGTCALISQIPVTIYTPPVFTNSDLSICAGDAAVLGVPGMSTYSWDGVDASIANQANPVVFPTASSSYSVTVTNAGGCEGTTVVDVAVKPAPVADILLDSVIFCAGSPDMQLAAFFNPDYTYAWSPSLIFDDVAVHDPFLSAESSQPIVLSVALSNGCVRRDTAWVEVLDSPDLSVASDNITICEGQMAMVEVFGGAGNMVWSPTNRLTCVDPSCSQVSIQPSNVPLTYTVTNVFDNGCADSLQIVVQPTVLQISTNSNITLCPSELPIQLFGKTITSAGRYCQTFQAVMGNCDSIHCVDVFVKAASFKEEKIEFCAGSSVVVGGTTYTESDTVCVTYTNQVGCDSVVCRLIVAHPVPDLDSSYTALVGQGEPVMLEFPDGYGFYEWSPATHLSCTDCPNPVFTPTEFAEVVTYTVKVGFDEECSTEVTYKVDVNGRCNSENFRFPTAFTPDGDNLNDTFFPLKIPGGKEKINNFRLYNAWGNLIYEGKTTDEWDGTIDGKVAPAEVYIWVLHLLCPDGTGELIEGNVTLIR